MPNATLTNTVIEAKVSGNKIEATLTAATPITAEFLGRPGEKGEPGQDAIISTPDDILNYVAALDGAINS